MEKAGLRLIAGRNLQFLETFFSDSLGVTVANQLLNHIDIVIWIFLLVYHAFLNASIGHQGFASASEPKLDEAKFL